MLPRTRIHPLGSGHRQRRAPRRILGDGVCFRLQESTADPKPAARHRCVQGCPAGAILGVRRRCAFRAREQRSDDGRGSSFVLALDSFVEQSGGVLQRLDGAPAPQLGFELLRTTQTNPLQQQLPSHGRFHGVSSLHQRTWSSLDLASTRLLTATRIRSGRHPGRCRAACGGGPAFRESRQSQRRRRRSSGHGLLDIFQVITIAFLC
mmetsp:Transcript_127374/g.317940  ORF Transcript_127374/g.317940 Transcript_127374/m.317940 type:complete len:207 (+) Transcript_127374:120-740(+)